MRTILNSRRHHYVARASVFLIIVALIAGMAGCSCNGTTPASQDLKIQTWDDLNEVRNNLGGHHTLMNSLNSTTRGYKELVNPDYTGGRGWEPIGTLTNPFEGIFDGQGFEISDLFIYRPDEDEVGLFRRVEGLVKNVGLVSVNVTGNKSVGALVGYSWKGTLDGTNQPPNSMTYSNGTVTGEEDVGGLVGNNYGGRVKECESSADVFHVSSTPYEERWRAGGLVGLNSGTVQNCNYNGVVNGDCQVGGLVGFNEYIPMLFPMPSLRGLIEDCGGNYSVNGNFAVGGVVGVSWGDIRWTSFKGTVNGTYKEVSYMALNEGATGNAYSPDTALPGSYVGGVVGVNEGTVEDCSAEATVEGYQYVGGLAGANGGNVSRCSSSGDVTGESAVGGLVGYNTDKGIVSNSNSTSNVTGISDFGDLVGRNEGLIRYNLTVSSTSGGEAMSPGEGTFTYDEGTVVNLVAAPDEGYRFDGWTGGVSTIADVNVAVTIITMNDNYSITANFNDVVPRQVITLDFATFWPSGDFQAAVGHENWMNAITDLVETNTSDNETGYTVKWNVSYRVAPPDLWSGVLAGTYDVIVSGPSYHGGIMPLWEGPEYPADLCRQNALTMSMAIQALYDEFTPLQNEMAAQNLKVMHFWSTGPGYFLMTEGNDVRTLEDFAALTEPIRAANPASVRTIQALGAEALRCPMSQALEKFDAGTIAGILCPTDTLKGFGLSAYVRTGTFAPFGYHFVFMKVMCPDTWDDLPSEVQDAFDEVNEAWPEYYGKLRTWGEADGLEHCYDEIPGFTVYDLPTENPTEYQNWVDATAHLVDEWIGGDATRQALWDNFVELDEYYATTPPYSTWTPGASPPPVPTFP